MMLVLVIAISRLAKFNWK